MPDAPVSPVTGKPMVRGVRPMTLTYKGQSVTVDMPGWYCPDSDEGVHSGEDMKVSDEALRLMKVEAEGLLSSDEIRRIRKGLGLTQREAGEVIGGGPNAFQKYESGDVLPARAVSNFLRVLERHPEEVGMLKAARGKRAAAAPKGRAEARRSRLSPGKPSIPRRKGPTASSLSKA